MLEVAALGIGTTCVKVLFKQWSGSEATNDIVGSVVDALASRIPEPLVRRNVAKQFNDMPDRIATGLIRVVSTEFGHIPSNEVDAACNLVNDLIATLDDGVATSIAQVNADPTALELALRSKPEHSSGVKMLSEPATELFKRVLTEVCNYLVEISVQLPAFHSAALVEILSRQNEILERVTLALDRLPQPEALKKTDDTQFDLAYQRTIARHLDRLQLFGLNLGYDATYQLSIAYITLNAAVDGTSTKTGSAASTSTAIRGATNLGNDLARPAVSDGEITRDELAETGADEEELTESTLRVDQALARSRRHLIRGEAGCGKTTLLQWLAVSAARRELSGDLEEWNTKIPFFLQLRRYAGRALPKPEDFLEFTAPLEVGQMPVGWVHRTLDSGKGLILIDGVDEFPVDERAVARDWLSALVQRFPESTFIVTSRPPAVSSGWVNDPTFVGSELLSMSLPDTLSFIRHWHDAARSQTSHDAEKVAELRRLEEHLGKTVRDDPQVRRLATLPLLCAMLCALNRDRKAKLPHDRMELYRITLETMLDRRDIEREISDSGAGKGLGYREKRRILESLAYGMIVNSRSDVATADAVAKVADVIEFMPSVPDSAGPIFQFLLLRSGLLREPTAGRIDFVHRTFQEYLAAARAISQNDVQVLLNHATEDGWREVIVLAAGHADLERADQLVGGLLQLGDRDSSIRHSVHLLAVACLETVAELTPGLHRSVRDALEAALPPINMTEAKSVASAGSVAAALLRRYRREHATTAAACVRALCLIGGDDALSALEEYRSDRRKTVIRELLRGWDYFDKPTYVARILAKARLQNMGTIMATEPETLSVLSQVPSLNSVLYRPDRLQTSLNSTPNSGLITQLELTSTSSVVELSELGAWPSLSEVSIKGCSALRSIKDIPPSVEEITIESAWNLRDVSGLANLPNLKRATITIGDFDPSPLRDSRQLDFLRIVGSGNARSNDLAWVAELTNLRRAHFRSVGGYSTETSWINTRDTEAFTSLTQLKHLALWGARKLEHVDNLPESLEYLDLFQTPNLRRLGPLPRGLRRIDIDGTARIMNWSFLDRLPNLSVAEITDCPSLSRLPAFGERLLRLVLFGTGIRNLDGVEQFVSLNTLAITPLHGVDLSALLDASFPEIDLVIDPEEFDLVPESVKQKHRIVHTTHRFGLFQ